MGVPSSFPAHFASCTAPRASPAPKQRHEWLAILVIAVWAVICGADGWEAIEEYGKAQAVWFAQLWALPHGLPSHATWRRGGARLEPEALTQGFLSWSSALSELSGGDLVAGEGKTLRHAFDRASATAAMHMVRAWASAPRRVLGQGKGEDKSNEIPTLPQLFPRLDLAGATVTMDAMGCQKERAQVMTEQGADDGWALKKNPGTLHDNGTLVRDAAQGTAFVDITHADHARGDGAHGRLETRRYWSTSEIEWVGAQAAWAALHSGGMGASRRERGEQVEIDTRYVFTSLPCASGRCAHAVREHWGIENSFHWGLDVSCTEDAGRSRKDQGAPTFSLLRPSAVNLLRRESSHTRGLKARRKRAGGERASLLRVFPA
jgi:predicted transposase YbfD/YdcC